MLWEEDEKDRRDRKRMKEKRREEREEDEREEKRGEKRRVWCHLFQSAHRWSHFPADQLPVWITALQGGLVLSHERHMEHHQDAGKQFTILFGVVWFFLPVLVDLWLLSREIVLPFTSGSGKVADKV
eukprot:Skav207000  [mRNA]  locus=scaffold1299:71374:72381:- [translate_table: standard]